MKIVHLIRWILFIATVTPFSATGIQARSQQTFATLPALQHLHLPGPVHDLLAACVFDTSDVEQVGDTVFIQTNVELGSVTLRAHAVIVRDTQACVRFLLPDNFKLSTIVPALKPFDIFACKQMQLVVANYEHHDEMTGMQLREGAHLFGALVLSGPLKYLSWIVGDLLDEIKIAGQLTPDVVGSSFSAQLPGKISFLGGLAASDLHLAITIDEQSTALGLPSCTLDTQVQFEWPDQEPVVFSSSLDLHLNQATLSGSMDGVLKNLFGIYGLHTRGWSLGGTVDYTSLLATTGLVPISDLSMAFDLDIAGKRVHMGGKIATPGLSGIGDLAFEGRLETGLSIGDCIDCAGGILEETPTVEGTTKDLHDRVDGCMPNVQLGDIMVFFSPRDVEIGGIEYSRGVIIEGCGRLFGSDAQLFIDVGTTGIKVVGYLQEMKFGPLTITGAGFDRIMDTPDDGLILDAMLTLEEQYCYMSGVIEIDILGGISTETTIDISRDTFGFNTHKKLFDLFDCGMTFSSHLNENHVPIDFYVRGYMHQSALTALQNILSKTARSMALKKMQELKQKRFSLSELASTVYNGFWNVLAGVVGNTFNITEFSFESRLEDLVGHTRLPKVAIKGIVLGKAFELNDITFDLRDPIGSAREIVGMLAELF